MFVKFEEGERQFAINPEHIMMVENKGFYVMIRLIAPLDGIADSVSDSRTVTLYNYNYREVMQKIYDAQKGH